LHHIFNTSDKTYLNLWRWVLKNFKIFHTATDHPNVRMVRLCTHSIYTNRWKDLHLSRSSAGHIHHCPRQFWISFWSASVPHCAQCNSRSL